MNDNPENVLSVVVDGPGPALVVDFKEFSTNVTLSAALAAAHPDRPLRRIDAVAAVTRAGSGLETAAAHCVAQVIDSDCEPGVIFGYCSAAGLALHLAAGLERRGLRRPPVILVEPSWPTPGLVRQDVEALSGAGPGGYQGPLDVASIVSALRGQVERNLRAEGLEAEEIELCLEIMAERHREWFAFLAAAEEGGVPPNVLPAGVLLADDGQRFPHPRWPTAPIRLERLPGRSGGLLGQPEAMAVIECLREKAVSDPGAPDPGYWFGPQARADDHTRVSDLLLEAFSRTPDADAVTDERETISYAELHRRALRLSMALRGRGVGREEIVAICAERSVSLCVAIVAVLLADGAYLPLDPSWPSARLERILDEAAPRVVLGDARGLAALDRSTRAPLLGLDGSGPDGRAAVPVRAEGRGPGSPVADDLAYVLYTSGSTGWPKGVAVPHRGLVNRLRWMQERFGIGVGDSVLQKTPYTFDVSVWEFLWPLMAGARLVMARPEGHRDPEYLAEVIRSEQVTVTHFVPSMLALYLAAVEPHSCPSLRQVICSGEALSPAVANRFTASHAAELHNLYGPTEASIDVTAWTCRRPENETSVPIGTPISGVLTAVRDARGRPVTDGGIGELHLGGPCLARGYLGREDLTGAAFVEDPCAPGVRLYRTGDLVRRDAEGVLRYHGRLDHQVKLNGVRIELGEIESCASEYAAVENAAAVVREGAPGSVRLALYVAPELAPESVAGLRAHLAGRLPAASVPAVIVPLAELPVTPNGKCDRAALPDPPRAGSGRGESRRRARRPD